MPTYRIYYEGGSQELLEAFDIKDAHGRARLKWDRPIEKVVALGPSDRPRALSRDGRAGRSLPGGDAGR